MVIIHLLLMSCEKQNTSNNDIMSLETSMKNTLDTLLLQCWNKKEIKKLELIASTEMKRRVNKILVADNRKEVEANIAVFTSGFPDLHITIDYIHISDSKAFLNWTFEGTNTGVFGEFPATGKKVKVSGISKIFFNSNGKIEEEELYYNELDLLQQLGYTLKPPNFE